MSDCSGSSSGREVVGLLEGEEAGEAEGGGGVEGGEAQEQLEAAGEAEEEVVEDTGREMKKKIVV